MGKRIIIVGGGVAGLSTGIYGQMNGFETEIFEMHNTTGGQCTAWERKGYRFDYCLHWLVGTADGVLNKLWKELDVINKDTIIYDHEVHSGYTDEQGNEFIIYANIDRWEQSLLEMAPEDKVSITKMCRDMRKVASFQPFGDISSFGEMISFTGNLLKLSASLPILLKYGRKTCQDYFAKLKFKNTKLNYFLNSLIGDKDFSALAYLMMLGWFHSKNAGYLMGGSLPLARRMVERYKSLGGKVLTGKRVVKILTINDKAVGIQLSDGSVIKSDYVVSAADGHATIFDMLEGKYVSEKIQYAYKNWDLFTPLVQVSFGINKEVPAGFPSKIHLVKDFSIGSTKLGTGYSFMNYSFDPSMAPGGKTVIVLRYESAWDVWKDMTKDQYKAEKETIKTQATAILEKHYPGITEFIEVVDIATPSTNVKYTGVWKGSYEGFFPSSKNITKSLKNTLPGLGNFFMAGQWLSPGGGLPPSALSGKVAIKQICSQEKQKFTVTVGEQQIRNAKVPEEELSV